MGQATLKTRKAISPSNNYRPVHGGYPKKHRTNPGLPKGGPLFRGHRMVDWRFPKNNANSD